LRTPAGRHRGVCLS